MSSNHIRSCFVLPLLSLLVSIACLVEEPADPTFGDDGTTGADSGGPADSTVGDSSGSAGSADAGACVDAAGEFDELLDWSEAANPGIYQPFSATHVVHAPPVVGGGMMRDPATARVMMMGGYQDQHLWNQLDGTFSGSTSFLENAHLWCSGHTITPQGSLFFAGGGGGDASNGIASAFRFDHLIADDGTWTTLAPMNYSRWYPTLTMLADGRVLVFGGLPADNCTGTGQGLCEIIPGCTWSGTVCEIENGYGQLVQQTPEIYDPETNVWTLVEAAGFFPPLYPLMFLLPDGNVMYAGGENTVRPPTRTSTSPRDACWC